LAQARGRLRITIMINENQPTLFDVRFSVDAFIWMPGINFASHIYACTDCISDTPHFHIDINSNTDGHTDTAACD
jgi:hypothetical protein